jgi:hypothetical protein
MKRQNSINEYYLLDDIGQITKEETKIGIVSIMFEYSWNASKDDAIGRYLDS